MKDCKLRRNTKDSAKNTSSLRTFPLVEPIEKILKRKKQENQIQRKLCGKNYSTEYLDYVNVDEFGQLIKPAISARHLKKYWQRIIFDIFAITIFVIAVQHCYMTMAEI